MSAAPDVTTTSAPPRHGRLPAELLDGITEIVTSRSDPYDRSEIVCGLVEEIYESVVWLLGAGDRSELESLHGLVEEAAAHRRRTAPRPPVVTVLRATA